jgi:hypothetical protein
MSSIIGMHVWFVSASSMSLEISVNPILRSRKAETAISFAQLKTTRALSPLRRAS